MRYFSFASRCRKFTQINTGKRFVSYKTRKNLVSVMSDIVDDMAPEAVMKSAATKKYHCTNFDVSIISNGAFGSSSLFVRRDNAACLFNCGEGTQRLSVEHGLKLFKTRTVFLTYHSWKSIGGIMSFCLSLQQQGANQIVIYGPPLVKEMILALRLFVTLKRLALKIITDQPSHMYDDSLFKIQFVPIYPVSKKNVHKTVSSVNISHVSDNDSDTDDLGSPSPKRRCHSESREPSKVQEDYSLCYICETPEFGMHLDVDKCLGLGIPYGPQMGLLKNKTNVILQNGKVVEWKDVCQSYGKPEYFIVVDCPGEEFLEPFVNEPQFIPYQGSSLSVKAPGIVYHFTENVIMERPMYQEWMSRFPPSTMHIVLNRGNPVLDHVGPYRLQEKLNFIDPIIFPKLKEDNVPEVKAEYSGFYPKHAYVMANDIQEPQKDGEKVVPTNQLLPSQVLNPGFNLIENRDAINIMKGISTLRWKVYPKDSCQFSHSVYFDRKCCLSEIEDIEEVREKIKELKLLKERWEASEECMALPEYPKLRFLGTGSSAPQALRNTSAILIELESGHLVLLDCGEGTYGQMLRFFGKDGVRDILKRLRLIYVSHQHADHHLGIINLLTERYEILSQCKREEYKTDLESSDISHLLMILPASVRNWVHASNKVTNLLYDARIISSCIAIRSYNALKRYSNNLGIKNLKTVAVPHSYESFGVTFSTSSGYKITYSGDTLPSDNLVELGRDSDLLIHEATFEDGLETMAREKNHSTISQALDIGRRMGAKFVMLTHFSQRYSHFPLLKTRLPENAGIAFDNMMVTPKTLPFLSSLEPFYKKIFAEKLMLLNNQTIKRIFKDERVKKQSAQMKM